jgi:ABC-2 type transport system ATP-binding protein
MNSNEIISCRNIVKFYDSVKALSDVSFSVEQGESLSVVGANGAGKTTLFNIIMGFNRPDEGVCKIFGTNTEQITPSLREKIGLIADHASPVPWASANDIARLYSSLYKGWNKDIFLENVALWKIDIYRKLNQLSKGQKRLAEIALVVATVPQLLILDEPFNGLDSVMRISIQRLLKKMQKQDKMTIVYSTHIISELSSVADRMLVLRSGMNVFDRRLSDFSEKPEEIFVRFYSNELDGN